MTYNIQGKTLLLPIDRTHIIDIAVNDVLNIEGFPGASYTWTTHDRNLVETNPDDDIYLQVERVGENHYKTVGLILNTYQDT